MNGKLKEGWFRPWESKKWHYFRAGRSLCGKWGFPGELSNGMDNSPDNCADCRRKRFAETKRTTAE